MTNDQLISLLIGFGYLTAGIWGATEILAAFLKDRIKKEALALMIGIPVYLVFTWLEIFEIPVEGLSLPKKLLAGAIFGFLAIGMSALLNDKLVNPVKQMLKKD